MITTRLQTATRLLAAAIALGTLTIGLAAAPSTDAAGLRNCVDVAGPQSGRVACYEDVWADGSQVRMTFSNQSFTGAKPGALDPFYVVAAQTNTPQGAPPNAFAHDHVARSVPQQNHGQYTPRPRRGYGRSAPSWSVSQSTHLTDRDCPVPCARRRSFRSA